MHELLVRHQHLLEDTALVRYAMQLGIVDHSTDSSRGGVELNV